MTSAVSADSPIAACPYVGDSVCKSVMLYDINADIAAQVMRGSMLFAKEHAEEGLKAVLGKPLYFIG